MNQDRMEIEAPDQREVSLKTISPTGESGYLPIEWESPFSLQKSKFTNLLSGRWHVIRL